jgi:hypothetical protein
MVHAKMNKQCTRALSDAKEALMVLAITACKELHNELTSTDDQGVVFIDLDPSYSAHDEVTQNLSNSPHILGGIFKKATVHGDPEKK